MSVQVEQDGMIYWTCFSCDLNVWIEPGKSATHNCSENNQLTHVWVCEVCAEACIITPGLIFHHDCPEIDYKVNCLHFPMDEIKRGVFLLKWVDDKAKGIGSIVHLNTSSKPKKCDCGKE